MKTAIFIPVRTGSTRLPRKALLKIKGKSVIEHLIERVKLAKLPDIIVLCTTTNPVDTVLVHIAQNNGIAYFRGSKRDILDRHLNAALKYDIDFIVNVDGDDILCDPEYMDNVVELFMKTHADFIRCEGLPLGASPIGIKVDALKKVCQIKDTEVTETGWGRYFTETGLFKVEILEVEDHELRHPEIRMTLDYPEDYKFFKTVFDELYSPGKVFTLKEILILLRRKPHIMEINKHLQQEYTERIQKHAKVKLKKGFQRLLTR